MIWRKSEILALARKEGIDLSGAVVSDMESSDDIDTEQMIKALRLLSEMTSDNGDYQPSSKWKSNYK